MKSDIYILVIEDEPEVLDSIIRDITEFEEYFNLEMADTAEEAEALIEEIVAEDGKIGLVLCDHVLPGKNGVELLVEMQNEEKTKLTRKVLITGQAGLDETVKAVNEADLKHYIAKPWQKEELVDITRNLLTDYVIENVKDPLPYMKILDSERIAESLRTGRKMTDQ